MEESLCFIYRQMNTSGAYINKRIVTKCIRYSPNLSIATKVDAIETLNVFTKEIRKHAIKEPFCRGFFFFFAL